MIRLTAAALCLLAGLGLGACGSAELDERHSAPIERAVFLFQNYAMATAKQDVQVLTILRGDLRRLCVEAFVPLVAALQSKDQDVQGYAAFALGFSGNRNALQPLMAVTSHPDETVRGNAIAAIGQLGFTDASMEPFKRLVGDPVAEVRQAALFGLTSIVSENEDCGMLGAVHGALSDPDPGVKTEALVALSKMRRKESVPAILGGPIKDVDPRVRTSAALALGAIGANAKEATPFLIEMLKDEIHRVVEGTWTALNRIHQKDFDRSYATWRDWYEDEQKVHYTCAEHREVSEPAPGLCPKCKRPLERISRDPLRKVEAVPAAPFTGLFVCPDHPEVITTTASKCGKPGCGKDLVPRRPDPVIYSCPDHPEILTTTPSKCGKPGCGKDLLPKK